ISGTFDGTLVRYSRHSGMCKEQSDTGEATAMFIAEDGAVIKNVILSKAQAEGMYCCGSCTLENVWWEDACKDAATFKQSADKTLYVIGGGAKGASDKMFQFNGRSTVSIQNFYAADYGKVIRSCGDCTANSGPRNIIIDGVTGVDGGVLCGINTNYGDTCKITNSCQSSSKSCDRYTGVVKGNGSSKKIGSGPERTYCTVSGLTSSCQERLSIEQVA
ncbi:pectate lyase, partial [Setomelanomma holmii]